MHFSSRRNPLSLETSAGPGVLVRSTRGPVKNRGDAAHVTHTHANTCRLGRVFHDSTPPRFGSRSSGSRLTRVFFFFRLGECVHSGSPCAAVAGRLRCCGFLQASSGLRRLTRRPHSPRPLSPPAAGATRADSRAAENMKVAKCSPPPQ